MGQLDSLDSKRLMKALVVHYHIRGRRKHHPITKHCLDMQEVIDIGQQSFPAFAERNPWICIDSKRATVFVGLDPERQIEKTA